jgi:FHA domain
VGEVRPYYEFVQEHADDSRAEFLSKVEAPHLHFVNLPDLELSPGFTTIKSKPDRLAEMGLQGLAEVSKDSASNAFGMMITLGRAGNNDVTVPDGRVSKFHAYFRPGDADSWTLVDANSTNGTDVDGTRLVPGDAHPLASGAKITFSETLEAMFLLPADLHAQLVKDRTWIAHGG